MNLQPKFYSKNDFLDFAIRQNCLDNTLNNLKKIPEIIYDKNLNPYKFSIIITDNNGYFDYELNYYSKDLKKHFFPYKIENGDLNNIINNFYEKTLNC